MALDVQLKSAHPLADNWERAIFMQVNVRSDQRNLCPKNYSVVWQNDGLTRSMDVLGIDISRSGVGFRCKSEVAVGTSIHIEDRDNGLSGYGVVRHCTEQNGSFFIGVQFTDETKQALPPQIDFDGDYYEFLQISSKAEPATIQRVYRFLAARFHPDNPETGDPERFLMLDRAYAVLSDLRLRAEYDASLIAKSDPMPAFESIDFMDGVDGELNRRLAVLSLLYRRCRANVENPKVSLTEMETLMGFPREYLDFTTWYLRKKKYITREDNSDFALTVAGVDFVEDNYEKLPILRKLLNEGISASRANQPSDANDQNTLMLGPGELPSGGDEPLLLNG
jgi:hypothetical protein